MKDICRERKNWCLIMVVVRVATMAALVTKDRMNGGVVLLGFDGGVKEYSQNIIFLLTFL